MYNSGIEISSFINQIESEADIITSISDDFYIKWINIVQQTLYRELIELFGSVTVATDSDLELEDITVNEDEAPVEYDDILKIYIGSDELVKSSVITAMTIPDKDIFYLDGNVVKIQYSMPYNEVTVIYRVRPKLVEETTEYISLPYEWIEMLAAKIRGELYKIANDDNMAAKWLADYNTQLESFKLWIAKRNIRYGE